MEYPFATSTDKDNIQGLLDSFCRAVGVASAIVDPVGSVLFKSNWQRICSDFHRAYKKTRQRCIENDTHLVQH